jgi:Holliday junction resolvasome RuvABC endonuclease subunit
MASKKPPDLDRPLYLTIGWDPGRHNCALAIYGPDGLGDTDVIEGIGDGDVAEGLVLFAEHVARQLDWYQPERCGIERYQLRGGKGFIGNMERVNLMIGIISAECLTRGIPFYLVTPSVHKTWAGKHHGATKRKKKLCMHTCPEFQHLPTEHEADAANVAKYCGLKVFTAEVEK